MRTWYHSLGFWSLLVWLGCCDGLMAIYSATQGEHTSILKGVSRTISIVNWFGCASRWVAPLLRF